jgi:hypothetical protein
MFSPLVANVDGGYPFYVDGAGNVRFTGTIGTFAHTAAGNVRAYGANATSPTVEDAGSATLRSGRARVALDPAFARSIEVMGRYRIFLMPDGDTNGLFVSERDPAGFVGHAGERGGFVTERGGPHAPLLPMKAPAGPVRRAR